MRTHVVLARNYPKRISRHLLNAKWLGDKLGKQAQEEDDWLFDVHFGFNPTEAPANGTLPSTVECCLIVASPLGLSVAFLSSCGGRISSKVTGANRCIPGSGAIWAQNKQKAKEAALKLQALHAEYWTEMETLGAMACD